MQRQADSEEQRAPSRPRQRALAGALVLCLIGLGLWQTRRSFIRSWFALGQPHNLSAAEVRGTAEGALRPVRVILVDGLGAAAADVLPGVSRVCRAGLSLTVDVGFPAVSLPVQHALWTGTWQNQSGVLFQVGRMERPIFESLPAVVAARSGRSVAVVESHHEIAASFPFAVVSPAGPPRPRRRMSAAALHREALAAARSDDALVFIHVLGVDKAGHTWGAGDPRYLAAAQRADRVVQAVWEARRPDWSVLVLSDHGHLRGPGGHGGTEDEVARVRACLAGPSVAPGSRGAASVVDLTRVLADALGVRPPRSCQGRGLARLVGTTVAPQQPPLFRFGVPAGVGIGAAVILLFLAALRLCGASPRGALLALPWGVAAALGALILAVGAPSLSTAYIYSMWSPHLLAAGLPAMLWPALVLWRGPRTGLERSAALLPLLAGGLAPALVLLGLTGWPVARPPLVPQLTAWASTLLGLAALTVFALAAAWLALGGRGRSAGR